MCPSWLQENLHVAEEADGDGNGGGDDGDGAGCKETAAAVAAAGVEQKFGLDLQMRKILQQCPAQAAAWSSAVGLTLWQSPGRTERLRKGQAVAWLQHLMDTAVFLHSSD